MWFQKCSQGISIGIVTELLNGQPMERSSTTGEGEIFFPPQKCPDRASCPPSPLMNKYCGAATGDDMNRSLLSIAEV